ASLSASRNGGCRRVLSMGAAVARGSRLTRGRGPGPGPAIAPPTGQRGKLGVERERLAWASRWGFISARWLAPPAVSEAKDVGAGAASPPALQRSPSTVDAAASGLPTQDTRVDVAPLTG